MVLKVSLRTRVLRDKIKLIRKLSSPGKILVKKSAFVKPEDVVAEGFLASGFRSIPLAKSLDVNREAADKFLTVKVGDKVLQGQTIGVRKRVFGEVKVNSPIDGIVGEYDKKTGFLRIEFISQKVKLTAACWGKVTKIWQNSAVEIETRVLKITGVTGVGRPREGELRVFCKPADFLLPNLITPDLKDKIIFGGAQITRTALAKALSLGVSGIIAGGIGAADFFEAGGGKLIPFGYSDVGITLVILEGFGLRTVEEEIYKALSESAGKFAIIDGMAAEVILPQAEQAGEPVHSEKKPVKTPTEKILKIGDRVRITDPAHLGLIGKVTKLPKKLERAKIGLESYLVEIETNSGKIVQPYTNLEVLL